MLVFTYGIIVVCIVWHTFLSIAWREGNNMQCGGRFLSLFLMNDHSLILNILLFRKNNELQIFAIKNLIHQFKWYIYVHLFSHPSIPCDVILFVYMRSSFVWIFRLNIHLLFVFLFLFSLIFSDRKIYEEIKIFFLENLTMKKNCEKSCENGMEWIAQGKESGEWIFYFPFLCRLFFRNLDGSGPKNSRALRAVVAFCPMKRSCLYVTSTRETQPYIVRHFEGSMMRFVIA